MGGKSSPDTPDYEGAAKAQAAGDLAASRAAAAANRVNQYTPYGSLVYSQTQKGVLDQNAYDAAMQKYNTDLAAYNKYINYDPSASDTIDVPPQQVNKPVLPNQSDFIVRDQDSGWSATQTLSPEEEAKRQLNTQLELGLLGTAQTGLGYVDKLLSNGGALDESKLSQNPMAGQSVSDAAMQLLQPQLNRDRTALETSLANKGLDIGSEAYKNAMNIQGEKENQLYTNAALQGINTALTSRQQGIQEQYAAQDRPLNVVNALRTGNQVNLPQFTNVPQQQTTSGPNYLQAAGQEYQSELGNANAQNAATGQALSGVATVASAIML